MHRIWLIPALATAWVACASAEKFYPDDPLIREPKLRDVGELPSRKLSDIYDLFRHSLATPGELNRSVAIPIPARGINTLGDPMEGTWWERRHYWKRMSSEELKRGPGGLTPPVDGTWTIISAKAEGVTPGLVIVDAAQHTYFVKFDSTGFGELATAAEVISSKLFYALGYHVPDNYIVRFKPDRLELGASVKLTDERGRKRTMVQEDLEALLRRTPKEADGRIRAVASLALPGKPIGPYRYNGTRSDDPNDIVPHEHRRDLRGMRLAAAWIDHDDSRAINTLDMLTEGNGTRFVKHHQQDFGSTLGSASYKPNSPRSGGEHLFGWRTAMVNFFSLGLYVPDWARASYPDLPSVGRFESRRFDPAHWVPEYPNPAFMNALPDDEFWAAKQIMSLSDADIRAIVEAGEYTDRRSAEYAATCLNERRNKIGRYAFARVLPLDGFHIEEGRLRWDDLAQRFGFESSGPIRIEWENFDNRTLQRSPVPEARSSALPRATGDGYWVVRLTQTRAPSHRIEVYISRKAELVSVAGVERFW